MLKTGNALYYLRIIFKITLNELTNIKRHLVSQGKRILMRLIFFQVKTKAKDQVFRPAMDIVDEAIRDKMTETNMHLKPKHTLLKRAANRYRANLRPDEPTDLDFTVYPIN